MAFFQNYGPGPAEALFSWSGPISQGVWGTEVPKRGPEAEI